MKIARNLAFLATVLLFLIGAQRHAFAFTDPPHWYEVFLVSHPECDNINAHIYWTLVLDNPPVYQGTSFECDDWDEDYCASNYWLEWDHEFMCEAFCNDEPNATGWHTGGENCNLDCTCEFPG